MKDDIGRRISPTLQSASLADCNLTKDELHALKRLKNDKEVIIFPRTKDVFLSVVMEKKDNTDKMDSPVKRTDIRTTEA